MSYMIDPWIVGEDSLNFQQMRLSESLTSIGNGYMGMRGTFEEDYSGDTHQGNYIGGIWFPDKTRVGWWKNGYPDYFGKAINSIRTHGIHMEIDGVPVDLAKNKVLSFRRTLHMESGVLARRFRVQTAGGIVEIKTERFVSAAQKELLAQQVSIKADYPAKVVLKPYLDGNVRNLDSNYEETFWEMLLEEETEDALCVLTRTKPNPYEVPQFTVCAAMSCWADGLFMKERRTDSGYVEMTYEAELVPGEEIKLEKKVLVFTNRDYDEHILTTMALKAASRAREIGYEEHLQEQKAIWEDKWNGCDVKIDGSISAQQGIRFNIFQLLCTYNGEDSRLNIGPKGFTGEKYGGATYWDTEAYCLPVYMAIMGKDVAKNLLLYRYEQLEEAYANAQKLGMKGALYPMVTFNGNECHNEWEITFEEIHRNGAIAHAIFNYATYTGDMDYMLREGFEVLLGIARYYTSRVHLCQRTGEYMIHGVTGPNEYENNVNNNWYTNRIAAWSIGLFVTQAHRASKERLTDCGVTEEEIAHMLDVSTHMYEPKDDERGIFVQHDTFMDKDLKPASEIPAEDRPLNQHWSWDRILRSCYIKQADVLQGLYFLNHLYDTETIRRNFEFYEPMTVHESSLSPCVHSILASQIGNREKAVEMYQRTARLDLDNINNDTEDGLHITSMAGSWLSVVHGFAGMRTTDGLHFTPSLPDGWKGYSFRIHYRERILRITVNASNITVELLEGQPMKLWLFGEEMELKSSVTHAMVG